MEREVRYCATEDGVRIAYSVEGVGPPLLAYIFFAASFAFEQLVPEYESFMERLGAGRQLIRFDGRGYGLSERDAKEYSLDAYVRDIEAVVKAVNDNSLSIWAPSNLRAVAAFTCRHPELVKRLVTYGSASEDPTQGFPPEAARAFGELSKGSWELAARLFADMICRPDFPDVAERLSHWYLKSATGEHIWKMIRAGIGVDVRPYLAQINVPTLILHRLNDPVYAFAYAQSLAATIPNARLVPLQGSVWAFFLGDTQSILDAVNAFLDEDPETRRLPVESAPLPPQALGFRTVLFTDVVENTALLRRIGDEAWRAVMREHEEIVRAALKEHGGTEISTSGDGFFASFGSSVRALQCAVEMQQALARRNESAGHPVEVRIGLNAGEPIEEGKDVLGTAVTMAARIMSQAGAGEILVSDVLRQLVAGKGFLFADRGEFVAKGFEEPVRVYEVRWRE